MRMTESVGIGWIMATLLVSNSSTSEAPMPQGESLKEAVTKQQKRALEIEALAVGQKKDNEAIKEGISSITKQLDGISKNRKKIEEDLVAIKATPSVGVLGEVQDLDSNLKASARKEKSLKDDVKRWLTGSNYCKCLKDIKWED